MSPEVLHEIAAVVDADVVPGPVPGFNASAGPAVMIHPVPPAPVSFGSSFSRWRLSHNFRYVKTRFRAL